MKLGGIVDRKHRMGSSNNGSRVAMRRERITIINIYVLGAVVSTLCKLIQLILMTTSVRQVLLLSSFHFINGKLK